MEKTWKGGAGNNKPAPHILEVFMEILVKTKNLGRREWLKWRTKGIGGSDVPVIAGISPHKSIYQLWQEKRGVLELEEEASDFAYFGTLLEPVVKKEFMKRSGLKVRAKNMILQSSEHPFMLADLDGVIYENGEMYVFEAKTASAYKAELWKDGIPAEYMLQIQHYMAVTGARKAYIAALVGGNDFYYKEIARDDGMIGKIIAMERLFWHENVLGGKEPAADGSKATTLYLNERYGDSNGTSIELPDETLALLDRFDEVSARMDELKAEKDAISNQLKACLGESESGYVGNRHVSWKQVSRTDIDKKRLEKEKPDIFAEYAMNSHYRRLYVA